MNQDIIEPLLDYLKANAVKENQALITCQQELNFLHELGYRSNHRRVESELICGNKHLAQFETLTVVINEIERLLREE